jgi:hypothetical protein
VQNPPAEGVRVSWADVPGPVRDAITEICGSAVTEARTQPGGFSPGVAARAADPQDLAATVCAMAGYLTHQSLLPAPPGLPTLRTFQAARAWWPGAGSAS